MTKKILTCSLLAPLFATLFAVSMSFGFASNADAGEFVMNGGGSYQFLYNEPESKSHRRTIKSHGGFADIQPEYRFADWFGLGLDLGFGGVVSNNYDSPHAQRVNATTEDVDYLLVTNDYKSLSFEALLTFKFIAPLKHVDLWFELGAGIYMLALDYLNDKGEFKDVGGFFDGIWPDLRGRLGLTIYFNEKLGFGFQGGASYLGWFQSNTFSVNGGIHFVGKY